MRDSLTTPAVTTEQPAAGRRMLRDIGLAFALSRGAFALVAVFATLLLPEARHEAVRHAPVPGWLDVFWRWDAIHYHTVAYDGYGNADDGGPSGKNAFFPLLPLLLRLTSMLLNGSTTVDRYPIELDVNYGFLLSGILVPNAIFLLACGFLYRLVLRDHDADTAARAVLYLALAPLALYFVVPYTEGLFLATTVACFYFLRRRAWFWAGVCGFLASLTRQAGVLLVLPFLWELAAAHRRERPLRPASREALAALAGLALIPLGLGAFMLELWRRTGDPLAFVAAQQFWQREFAPPWRTIADGLWHLAHPRASGSRGVYGTGILHAGLTLGGLLLAVCSVRSWRGSYTLYVAASFLLILSNHMAAPLVFHSMGRFVLVLFPLVITLARWGRRREVDILILVPSLILFALGVALYVRWYPVA